MAPLPDRRPPPARRSHPVRDASTTPSPGNKRRTAGFSPGGLDSLRLAPPADHRPAPRYGKGTVSVAGLRLARCIPRRFSATAPQPNRSAHPDNTVSAAEDRCRSAPSLPATNRCDPYRPCCADAAAKTSWPEFVISHCWLPEGRSALHRFPEHWDCKDETCPAFDITNRKIQRFRDELRLVLFRVIREGIGLTQR